jgi:hypothetical protein
MRNIKLYQDHLRESQNVQESRRIEDLWIVYYLNLDTDTPVLVGAWEDRADASLAYNQQTEEERRDLLTICRLEDAEEAIDPWTGPEGYTELMRQLEALPGLPQWASDAIKRRKRSRGAFGRF